MELNNRELAFVLWGLLFGGYHLATKKAPRKALASVLHAFLKPKILVVLFFAGSWVAASVSILAKLNCWTTLNLKTTLLWSVTFAFVTVFDFDRISEDNTYFRKTIRDIVSMTAVVTFVAEAYSFSLFVELLLLPFLAVVTTAHMISEGDPKQAPVHKVAGAILVAAGLAYVGYGLYQAAADFEGFVTLSNLREFAVPLTLSLMFLPFMYGLSVFASYERNAVRLRLSLRDRQLRRYALRRAITHFRLDLEAFRRWTRNVALNPPATREDARRSIAEVLLHRRRERALPAVPPEAGWSPYAAAQFLADHGLATKDYHRIDGEQWGASSPMVEIDKDALFSDNIAYYIDGSEHAALQLMISLNVNGRGDTAASERVFAEASAALMQRALGNVPPRALGALQQSALFDLLIGGRKIKAERAPFKDHAYKGYSRTLTITNHATENGA